ncbi:LOW QUALITY PROTEIN: chondrolectin [Centropristis striata]|uniref:LOW QUALITY PROTEIN: chondrolectin n=1 Tax=Centropristis striata TaxID=184440 RepID=UPI0027DFE528|nr:LOW QUALITY PROTEIN: chondrolectin [Centropristis striata]
MSCLVLLLAAWSAATASAARVLSERGEESSFLRGFQERQRSVGRTSEDEAANGGTILSVSGQTVWFGGVQSVPCYKIAYFQDVSSRVAFREARQACEVDGGSLLSIDSQAEQEHIEHLLQELRSGAVGGGVLGGGGAAGGGIADGDFWIGLTRVDGVDQTHAELSNTLTSCPQLYHWTDGSVASFRNWYFDEPSCGGEACVVMYHQPTALAGLGGAYLYQWNDDRCNMKHNFICRYEPESHLVKEHGDTPAGRGTEATAGGGVVKQPAGSEEVPPQVTMAGSSGMLLVYVIIPTIPLLLLILVASGTCCFQTLSRSTPRSKTAAAGPSNLWISRTPKTDTMEV